MAYTIASGPPGLESTHTWQSLVVLNNTDPDNGYIKLSQITGLYALPEAPDNSAPNVGRRGTTPYPTQDKTRAIQYVGVVRGRTLESVHRASARAISAFRDRNTEGTMVIAGVQGGPDWWFRARPAVCDISDEQVNGPNSLFKWERAFNLQLTLYDPRIYVDQQQSKAPGSGAAVLNNPGLTDTDPIITVTGFPGGTLELTNSANQRVLRFKDLPAAATTEIHFYKRQLLQGVVDRTGYQDPDDDWWDESVQGLLPGNNTVNVTNGAGTNYTWSATWYPPF